MFTLIFYPQDNRTIVGTLLAFDRHMNLVLGDSEEFRKVKSKKAGGGLREEKRALGLLLLRGENVVSLQVHGPPPPKRATVVAPKGPGKGVAAGRGMPMGMGRGGGMGGPGIVGAPMGMPMGAPMMGMPMGGGAGRGMPPGGRGRGY